MAPHRRVQAHRFRQQPPEDHYCDMRRQYDNPSNYYGKLCEIKTVKVGGSTLQDVKHTWDAIGNLTKRENVTRVETESFGYDFLDRLTSSSNYLFTFGNTGGPPNTVSTPWHAAIDANDTSWVADFDNNRIAKYDPSGVYQTSFGSAYLSNPTGVTRDGSGNFYVSSYWDSKVPKFDNAGNHVLEWGGYGTGESQFRYPADVVFANGYVYVADTWNHKVKYVDASRNLVGWWGGNGTGNGQFRWPSGIGADASGNIYVADTSNRRVQKFNASGGHLATWGSSGSGPGQFSGPKDVGVDSSGNVFVADTGNHRFQKLNPSGVFIMMWGSSGSGQSQFSSPYGVALTSARIYAVDTNNSRLQTFDSQTTAGWAYNQIGNMTLRDGVAYTYGSKPHTVTAAGSNNYVYDNNANMTERAGMSLTWDVENRLVSIPGLADFTYDGDGFRVKKNDIGINTVYANKYYEKNINTGEVTRYYYLGDKMMAYKQGTALRYVHQDHLTGTSLTTDSSGDPAGAIKYKPYGETRSSSGPLPAQKFTGQRLDDVGLYYYGARYYDPGLGRFISPDTIVPSFTKPQTLNRYSYAYNNPLRYRDPTGHEGEDDDAPTWRQWLGKVAKGARDFVVDQAKTFYRDWIASGPIERGERYAQVADDFLPAMVSFYAEKSQTLEGQSYIATQIVFTGGMIYLGIRMAAPGTAAETVALWGTRQAALEGVGKLPPALQAGVVKFVKESAKNTWGNFVLKKNPDGTYTISAIKPGEDPGAFAIYSRTINADGSTVISLHQEGYDPNGNLVHIDDK